MQWDASVTSFNTFGGGGRKGYAQNKRTSVFNLLYAPGEFILFSIKLNFIRLNFISIFRLFHVKTK